MSEFKKGTAIAWFEKAGGAFSEPETILELMYRQGEKEPYAAVCGWNKTENIRLLRDCIPVAALPPGAIPFLERSKRTPGQVVFQPGHEEETPEDADAPTGPALWIASDVQGVPSGFDCSKMVGQPFHDGSRRVIGIVARAGQGKIIVKVKPGLEQEVREMLGAGALPGASETPEPVVGSQL